MSTNRTDEPTATSGVSHAAASRSTAWPTALDLSSAAVGVTLGLRLAHLKIIGEIDEQAAETYRVAARQDGWRTCYRSFNGI